jgi:hypothetical protein
VRRDGVPKTLTAFRIQIAAWLRGRRMLVPKKTQLEEFLGDLYWRLRDSH